MKKLIAIGLLTLVTVVSVTFSGASVQAQSTEITARCTTAKAKFSTRLETVGTFYTKQTAVYAGIQKRVSTLIDTADTKGYDIKPLTAAYTNVGTKADVYIEAYDNYKESLTDLKNIECGQSDNGFVQGVLDARADLLVLRSASADVRATIRSETLPAVRDYATWLKEEAQTSRENE